MSFLFPGFLFALTAVAIPVIVHLFNFRKFKRIYFSNVRFLKSVKQETSASRKVKNRLILAARILAIVFMVLAFAQPYIPAPQRGVAGELNVVSIYLDNSFSMETVNREGTLLDEAKRRAKEIASAYSRNDKFQLLTNDFEGRHQRLFSLEDFQNAVDEVEISSQTRNLKQVVERQLEIFTTEPNSRKNLYLISDFQRSLLTKEPVVTDSSVAVHLVKLAANELPNVAVDSVWFESPVHRAGQPEKLIVRLRNHSEKGAKNIPIKVTINNQQKALGSLSADAGSSSSDTLSFSGLGAGWQSGEITITDYPVTFDDRFYFSFRIHHRLPILAINGGDANPYLQAVYRSDAFFEVDQTSSGNVNYSSLSQYPLLILNEVQVIPEGLSEQLAVYVRNGGSLMIFPAVEGDLAGLKAFLQALGTDVPQSVITTESKVTSINLQNPLFRGVFELVPRNLDLPVAKKSIRYSTQSNTNKRSILDFPGRHTFFGEYAVGQGRVYLSAVSLNEEMSNLVTHSVFVPLMYQVAQLSLKDQQLFYKIGRDQQLQMERVTLNASQTLKLKKDAFEVIPDVRQTPGGTSLYIADQIRQNGNYSLLMGDSVLAVFSFNDNRAESNLSYAGDEELAAQFPKNKPDILNSAEGAVKNAVQAANYGTQLWKLCLILALVFLAAEIFLIRFYKKAPKAAVASSAEVTA